MKLDEAIKHCEEVAYQKDMQSGFDTDNERYAMTDDERAECKKCAAEHRQLAEWLKAYKEQKHILDKISAEIEQLQLIGYATIDGKREIASRAVIQLIDKYKAESEGRMTKEDIISGLKMTINLFLFDPTTGETKTKRMLNDTDRTTVEACEGAIELLSGSDTTIECGDEVTTPAGRGVVLCMEHDRYNNVVFAVLIPSGFICRYGSDEIDKTETGKRWEKLADGYAEYVREVDKC